MVGPDNNGKFWTVAIRQRSEGVWMPITCFSSKPSIIRLYEQANQTTTLQGDD